jgi:hypothetical protein
MNSPLSLRVCRTNTERFTLPLKDWEKLGASVECLDCLAQCGDCEAGPFAEVAGDFRFANDLPELETLVRQASDKCQGDESSCTAPVGPKG